VIPDKAIINLTDESRWELELEKIKENIDRLKNIRNYNIEPLKCGTCNYCKTTKELTKIINYKEI